MSIAVIEKYDLKAKATKIITALTNTFAKPTVNKKESEIEILKLELKEMKEELDLKNQNFNYADEEYVEIAVLEREALKMKYSATLRRLKSLYNETAIA